MVITSHLSCLYGIKSVGYDRMLIDGGLDGNNKFEDNFFGSFYVEQI